jgi:hypothetical protein
MILINLLDFNEKIIGVNLHKIGWGPHLMKRRLLVRIPPPPSCVDMSKKKKKLPIIDQIGIACIMSKKKKKRLKSRITLIDSVWCFI